MAVQAVWCTGKCVRHLSSVWKAEGIWSLALSTAKNHLLTSPHPVRKRKIHEHPEGLGEVHLFPDITKWDTGHCCFNLSFGKESKWRLVPREQMHRDVPKAKTPWPQRGKGEASPLTQTCTSKTPWKHPSIVPWTHITQKKGVCWTCSKWVNSFKKHTHQYTNLTHPDHKQ